MGVNYATVIKQPTEAERQEQRRQAAIRQAHLRAALGVPLAPVSVVSVVPRNQGGHHRGSLTEDDKAQICEAWVASVQAAPEMSNTQRVTTIALELGTSMDSVYDATAGTVRPSVARGPRTVEAHRRQEVVKAYREAFMSQPTRTKAAIRRDIAAQYKIRPWTVEQWVNEEER
jgi:hypothetical protein